MGEPANTTMRSSAAVHVQLEVTAGAPLTKVLEAMLRVARKLDVGVCSTWNNQQLYVSADDTYQSAQARAQAQQVVPVEKLGHE